MSVTSSREAILEKLERERQLYRMKDDELIKAKISVGEENHSFQTEAFIPTWKDTDIARKIALTAKKPNAAEAWGKLLEKEQKVALKVKYYILASLNSIMRPTERCWFFWKRKSQSMYALKLNTINCWVKFNPFNFLIEEN